MNARTLPRLLPRFSLASYLAWEDDQIERHEFCRGEIFAMVGARRVHGTIVGNLAAEFRTQLKGSPCRVFHEGMKVQIGDDAVLYPDIFVTCDRADLATDRIFTAPTVVVEVLSPTTQAYDRGFKFSLYRCIASLQEYLLVDPQTWRVEAFRRNADGQWVLFDMSDGEALEAPSIGVRVPLAEVFDGVEPPSAAAKAPPAEDD